MLFGRSVCYAQCVQFSDTAGFSDRLNEVLVPLILAPFCWLEVFQYVGYFITLLRVQIGETNLPFEWVPMPCFKTNHKRVTDKRPCASFVCFECESLFSPVSHQWRWKHLHTVPKSLLFGFPPFTRVCCWCSITQEQLMVILQQRCDMQNMLPIRVCAYNKSRSLKTLSGSV